MRESPRELSHVELCVGESVRIDDQILTVLEICEGEVIFRIDMATDVELNDFETGNFGTGDFDYGAGRERESAMRLPPR